jgi:hypothetical protein
VFPSPLGKIKAVNIHEWHKVSHARMAVTASKMMAGQSAGW